MSAQVGVTGSVRSASGFSLEFDEVYDGLCTARDQLAALVPVAAFSGRTSAGFAIAIVAAPLLALLCYRRLYFAAERSRLIVKRVLGRTSGTPALLDLRDDAIYEGVRLMSLADYLASLDYEDDENVVKRMLAALAHSIGGRKTSVLFPLIPLIPASFVKNKDRAASLIARYATTEFPSLLAAAAAVDAASAWTLFAGSALRKDRDSMDLAYLGEAPSETLKPLPIIECGFEMESLLAVVASCFSAEESPHEKVDFLPTPFADELLPGLCVGMGGISPGATPFDDLKNRLLSSIFNRLAANIMVSAEFASSRDNIPYETFFVTIGGEKVYSPCALADKLWTAHTVSNIRTNLTSFGIALCVYDPVDASRPPSRQDYAHIPLAMVARVGILDVHTKEQLKQLSVHSSFEIWLVPAAAPSHDILGDNVRVTFYTGVEGFTGFHSGTEWERPWVTSTDRLTALTKKEAISALKLCGASACLFNLVVRKANYIIGGYGSAGVCNDSVALIEMALFGKTNIFPLLARADAKAVQCAVAHTLLVPSLPKEYAASVSKAVDALVALPSDVQVAPACIADALRRLEHCVMPESPFRHDVQLRADLPRVKEDWKRVLA